MKAYKFKLKPSKAIQTKFEQTLSVCCELYNASLQERRDAWKLNRISVNYHSQCSQLPLIKEIRTDVENVYSQVLQDVLRRMSKSFDNFFRRVKSGKKPGFPRFKSRSRFDSFCYPQKGIKLIGDKLHLSKIGSVRVRLHRAVEGTIKNCTIKKELNGWYVVFVVENATCPLNASHSQAVGIDVGLTHFATLSTGDKIANPRFFKVDRKALSRASRKLSREQTGTQTFKKSVKVLQTIHRRIRNRRNNFAHQLSRKLVNSFDAIFFENLNIKGMMKDSWLANSIGDAAWNQLISFTAYKAENAGSICATVNPKGTSQQCSGCGAVVKKDLSVRIHHCLHCGLKICRDLNASLNILARGLTSLGNQSVEAPSLAITG